MIWFIHMVKTHEWKSMDAKNGSKSVQQFLNRSFPKSCLLFHIKTFRVTGVVC